MTTPRKILVIDGNAMWVRSLFLAMAPEIEITFLRPSHPAMFRAVTGKPLNRCFGRDRIRDRVWDEYVVTPGFGKMPRLSGWVVNRRARRAARRMGGLDLVVFTLPHYAPLAARFRGCVRAYYAHDTFRFYNWPKERTISQEREMVRACDVAFAVAHGVQEDLQQHQGAPVDYLPMAVSSSFLDAIGRQQLQRPADLPQGRKVVGCTGQINHSYDWDLIEALVRAVPDVDFVFIGPVFNDAAAGRARSVFALPNVRHLGPRPHAQLPAYLQHFDVCLNPLAISEHNDRRSPLRLFDYLATNRPILSTGIREASMHEPHLEIGRTPQDCIDRLRRMLAPGYNVDVAARQAYIQKNTWEARAATLLDSVQRVGAGKTHGKHLAELS